ncbi:hypothetical protein MMC07_002241 [Pseudocyphellaria aurata]|nr:hypothetical protein [Pseudocyphellaria aurata]
MAFDLPSNIKAYGNPDDLAKDQDVDLVVCCTRVDLHYETIKPSLQQGKNVFVEWPLASNLSQALELTTLAKQTGAKTMIGLQGQASPIVNKVKSMIEQGVLGKVLSSSITGIGGVRSRDSISPGLKYFTERSVGGNVVTIGFGHMIDYVNFVLGEFTSFSSHLTIQRPKIAVIHDGKVEETVKTDVPDLIMLHGTLSSGIPLSASFRSGQPFKDDPGLVWNINGLAGEIKVQGSGPALQARDDDVKIWLHNFATDEVDEVKWESPFPELPGAARNVASLYEAFARGDEGGFPSFEDAVLRHRQIEELYASSEEGRRGVYV